MAPIKVSFFVWEASRGKILTCDNLQKKGFTLVNSCFICKEDSESTSHLLLHCKVARVLWDLTISWVGVSWVGVSWVASDSIKNHFLASEGFFGGKVKKKKEEVAWVLPHVIFWSIWRERNRRVFEDVETPIWHLKDFFIKTLFYWEKGKFSSSSLELVGLLDSLYMGCI